MTTLWEHSMWDPLYVSTLCGSTLYVSTLCVTTLCLHSMCDHSMGALYVSTLCVTTLWEHSMCEHEHRKVRKLPRKMNITSLGRMLQNTKKYENYQETSTSVLGPDVAAPKTSKKHEFYCKNTGQEHWRTPKSTRITTKNEHGRS